MSADNLTPVAGPPGPKSRPMRWLFWRTFWACAAAMMFVGVFFRTGFEDWLKNTPRGQNANKIGVQVIDDVARNLGVGEKKADPGDAKAKKDAPADPPVKKDVPNASPPKKDAPTDAQAKKDAPLEPPAKKEATAKAGTATAEPAERESRTIKGQSRPTDQFPVNKK